MSGSINNPLIIISRRKFFCCNIGIFHHHRDNIYIKKRILGGFYGRIGDCCVVCA